MFSRAAAAVSKTEFSGAAPCGLGLFRAEILFTNDPVLSGKEVRVGDQVKALLWQVTKWRDCQGLGGEKALLGCRVFFIRLHPPKVGSPGSMAFAAKRNFWG